MALDKGNVAQWTAAVLSLAALGISLCAYKQSSKYNLNNVYLSSVNIRTTGCHYLSELYQTQVQSVEPSTKLTIDGEELPSSSVKERAKLTNDFSRELNLCLAKVPDIDAVSECIKNADSNKKWKVRDDMEKPSNPEPHIGKFNSPC